VCNGCPINALIGAVANEVDNSGLVGGVIVVDVIVTNEVSGAFDSRLN
jgi:hypothetical protein